MPNWNYYKYAYLAFALLAPLGVFNYAAGLAYAAVFFAFSLWMLIDRRLPQTYLDSSASTHFDYASRFNPHNYIFAASLIAAAISIMFIPLPTSIVVFIFWSTNVAYVEWILPRILVRIFRQMLADYITEQTKLPYEASVKLVLEFQQSEDLDIPKIAASHALDAKLVEAAYKYYEVYLSRLP